jgi:hypothetical protein
MSTHNYLVFQEDGDAFVTAFLPGHSKPFTASTGTHPNFAEIVSALKNGIDADEIAELFSVEATVSQYFDSLSERVSVANGRVYFDGDEVDNSLTQQVIRFLDAGVTDWMPLVNFMENVAMNPNAHSREQLYTWLKARLFTITPDGCVIFYKGVNRDFSSKHRGPGIVNGERVNGHLDNSPGNQVELARSNVTHDPAIGCASGLHVATFEYARSWGPIVLEVVVNPRDVVSVPTECGAQKVRVCRYTVFDVVSESDDEPLRGWQDPDEDDFVDVDDFGNFA